MLGSCWDVTECWLYPQGIQLQQTLALGELSNIEHAGEVREALAQGIAAHQAQSRVNPKLAKVPFWLTYINYLYFPFIHPSTYMYRSGN